MNCYIWWFLYAEGGRRDGAYLVALRAASIVDSERHPELRNLFDDRHGKYRREITGFLGYPNILSWSGGLFTDLESPPPVGTGGVAIDASLSERHLQRLFATFIVRPHHLRSQL